MYSKRQTVMNKFAVIVLLATPLVFVASSGQAEESADVAPANMGQLMVRGESVVRLTLQDKNRRSREYSLSTPNLTMPAGQYSVREVQVEGGYRCFDFPTSDDDWFTITAGETHQIEIGAPLTPKVNTTRWGRLLVMNYALVDAGGREYLGGDTTNRPRFIVYAGEREVGTGRFEAASVRARGECR